MRCREGGLPTPQRHTRARLAHACAGACPRQQSSASAPWPPWYQPPWQPPVFRLNYSQYFGVKELCLTLLLLWCQGAVRVHGPANDARRLPNTLSLGICGLDAAAALAALSDSLAASAGAACHSSGSGSGGSGDACISGVLRAMAVRAPRLTAARLRRGACVCRQLALAPIWTWMRAWWLNTGGGSNFGSACMSRAASWQRGCQAGRQHNMLACAAALALLVARDARRKLVQARGGAPGVAHARSDAQGCQSSHQCARCAGAAQVCAGHAAAVDRAPHDAGRGGPRRRFDPSRGSTAGRCNVRSVTRVPRVMSCTRPRAWPRAA